MTKNYIMSKEGFDLCHSYTSCYYLWLRLSIKPYQVQKWYDILPCGHSSVYLLCIMCHKLCCQFGTWYNMKCKSCKTNLFNLPLWLLSRYDFIKQYWQILIVHEKYITCWQIQQLLFLEIQRSRARVQGAGTSKSTSVHSWLQSVSDSCSSTQVQALLCSNCCAHHFI